MPSPLLKQKVVCYIVRDGRLLVFEHLDEPWVSTEDDPDDGSGQKRFECSWIPLAQGHVLSGGQGALLGDL